MNPWLQGILLFGASILGGCGLDHAGRHQQSSAEKACHCACSVLPADFFGTPVSHVLVEGEQSGPWAWGGGQVVCLRPGEPQPNRRFAQIVQALEHADCVRFRKDGCQ